MADQPTVGELRKAALITDAQIEAAVKAFLEAPFTDAFPIADGLTLNLARAIAEHAASAAIADMSSSEAFRRTMVRTAILLARPESA
ncbi:hypothetical protein [Methylobacterium gnaphalii]|nr:hypothetical protein [Methylobacterium gnaphalii]GJD70536.1 hypothetical protein MMMDOFMJ_3485 [Methylobacterium gnaphalii]